MDQPYSRMADMLLDKQYYNINDPRPYDDTGWTLGAVRNVKTLRVTETGILKEPMTLLTSTPKVAGQVIGSSSAGIYVVNHNTENTLATFRFRLKDVKMQVAEEPFKVDGKEFSAGSFVIQASDNGARNRIEKAAVDLGLKVTAIDEMPKIA